MDFETQARSWSAWLQSRDHNHHYGKLKQYDIEVDQQYFDQQTEILENNYKFLEQVYVKYPGTVYCLEEFTNQKPYDREYNWVNPIKLNSMYSTELLNQRLRPTT